MFVARYRYLLTSIEILFHYMIGYSETCVVSRPSFTETSHRDGRTPIEIVFKYYMLYTNILSDERLLSHQTTTVVHIQ